MSNVLNDTMLEMEQPVQAPSGHWWHRLFRRNKIRCIFVFPDGHYVEQYLKQGKYPYFLERKKKELYQIIPRCILRSGGKAPMMIYFYNNPCPLYLKYRKTPLSSEMLQKNFKIQRQILDSEYQEISPEAIWLDSESLSASFSANVLKNLYAQNTLSIKVIIILCIVALVAILIFTEATGKTHIFSSITNTGKPQTTAKMIVPLFMSWLLRKEEK